MRDTASHNRDLPAGRVRLDTGTNCRDDLTSDGHHYASAGFARRFAPDMARRVNAILAEARWDLVPSTAGSQRNVDSLRAAPGDLHKSASELQAGGQAGLGRLRDGSRQTALAGDLTVDSAPRLLAGALLPIALSDEAFQTMHLSLPLTWMMPAFRARLFGAFDGAFWPAHRVVAGVAAGGLLLGGWLGGLMGRGRCIPTPQWRPPLDME